MKKICLCISCIEMNGGTERVTSILSNHLIEKCIDVSILSYESTGQQPFFNINPKVKIDYLFSTIIKPANCYFQIVSRLRKYFKKNIFDVIIAVDVVQMIFLVPALFGIKTKLIGWEQFNYTRSYDSALQHVARKLTCRFADAVITLTDEDCQKYKENVRLKIILRRIYNYIPQFEAAYVNDKKLGQPIKILSIGRLEYQKGFDLLLQVADLLKKERKNWIWTIVGEGTQRETLEREIYELNLKDCVKIVGASKNVSKFYAEADIFVFTSRYEGFGLVIVEAQASGLPVISFDCKMGPSELVAEGTNGYLIPCFDLENMKDKIINLLDNRDLRASFSSKSKVYFDKFQSDVITNQWLALFDDLANT